MATPRRSPASHRPMAGAGTAVVCMLAVVVGLPLFAVTAYGVSSALGVVAAAPPSCDDRPEHPRCQDPPPCEKNPDKPRCDDPPPCEKNPDKPRCDDPPPCEENPDRPRCEDPGDETARPELVSEFPRDGATRVSRFTDVRAHFSEAVFGVSTRTFRLFDTRRGFFVPADVLRSAGSSRWVLDPDRRLARQTRYVAVLRGRGNGIEDAAGNALLGTRWSFRTGD